MINPTKIAEWVSRKMRNAAINSAVCSPPKQKTLLTSSHFRYEA